MPRVGPLGLVGLPAEQFEQSLVLGLELGQQGVLLELELHQLENLGVRQHSQTRVDAANEKAVKSDVTATDGWQQRTEGRVQQPKTQFNA